MEIQIGSAKAPKYGVRESGDTVELIERPHGGISAVLVDGQRSGQAAKRISNIVARKAISLLGEGVRDGAAARASHDYLRTHRSGQVTAELQIASVDLWTGTLVVSRNSRCPAILVLQDELSLFDEPSEPIGIHPSTKPVIQELPLVSGTYVVLYTDGLEPESEGKRIPLTTLALEQARMGAAAQTLADALLLAALEATQHRPRDDASVLVLAITGQEIPDGVRRLTASLPVDPVIAARSVSRSN